MTELRTQIYNVANAVTGIANNLHYSVVPDSQDLPYCVYDIIIDNADYDTTNNFQDVNVQFALYGRNLSTIESYYRNLKSDLTTISKYNFSSSTLTKVKRNFTKQFYDNGIYGIITEINYEFQE